KGANFDSRVDLFAADIPPMVTWGTSPQDALPITEVVPDPANAPDENRREAWTRSLAYMGLTPGTRLVDVPIDRVFIGSCTNGRIEDLRAAAEIARGRKVAPSVSAMVVPGSGLVKAEAEKEGLDKIFIEAGFEWRIQGCSMCLAMNADRLEPGQRCASTSNRNFEGRQGRGGRPPPVSPAVAAAGAVQGPPARRPAHPKRGIHSAGGFLGRRVVSGGAWDTAPRRPSCPTQQKTATSEPVGPPAGFWIRFLAYLVDGFILVLALGLIGGVIVGLAIALGGSGKDSEAAIGVAV